MINSDSSILEPERNLTEYETLKVSEATKPFRSTFESLPSEIRLDIYTYLIKTAVVRCDEKAEFTLTNNGTLQPCNLIRAASSLGSMVFASRAISNEFLGHLWSTSFLKITIDHEFACKLAYTKISDLSEKLQKFPLVRKLRLTIDTSIDKRLTSAKESRRVRSDVGRDWAKLFKGLTEDCNVREIRIKWRFWPSFTQEETTGSPEDEIITRGKGKSSVATSFPQISGAYIRVRYLPTKSELVTVQLSWSSKDCGADWDGDGSDLFLWSSLKEWKGKSTGSGSCWDNYWAEFGHFSGSYWGNRWWNGYWTDLQTINHVSSHVATAATYW